MSSFTTLHGVQLQPCCLAAIKTIRERIHKANILKIGAPTCIFAQMFIGPSKSEIASLYSVSTADWAGLAELVKGIEAMTRRTIAGDAALEVNNHPTGQLGDFWESIYEKFSS